VNQPIGKMNNEYWTYLCGSRATKKLGIEPADPIGVSKFDSWFFSFYPYLNDSSIVPWSRIGKLDVLEIGLGYGSMSRRLAQASKSFICCDISKGPVSFVRQTSERALPIQGSSEKLPLRNESFDMVVSIGCLHHTGALQASIDECMRVLRPNGTLIIMVYYAYSYKQWLLSPIKTMRRWRSERKGVLPERGVRSSDRIAFFYDRNQKGETPPFTEYVARKQIENALHSARSVNLLVTNLDNIGDLLPLALQSTVIDQIRITLLRLPLFKWVGLDLYVTARK